MAIYIVTLEWAESEYSNGSIFISSLPQLSLFKRHHFPVDVLSSTKSNLVRKREERQESQEGLWVGSYGSYGSY